MFSLTDFKFASDTRVACPRLRLRLLLFFVRMCRLPCLRRRILPDPVTLKRLATAFLVFAFPAFLAIGSAPYLFNVRYQVKRAPYLIFFSAKTMEFYKNARLLTFSPVLLSTMHRVFCGVTLTSNTPRFQFNPLLINI